jgi:hypothetical protein
VQRLVNVPTFVLLDVPRETRRRGHHWTLEDAFCMCMRACAYTRSVEAGTSEVPHTGQTRIARRCCVVSVYCYLHVRAVRDCSAGGVYI